jgi:hypothetical protein
VALYAADARRRRFNAALDQLGAEGGQPARLARYAKNCETLIAGMAELGFRPFLKPEIQAPIIVTFHAPADPRYAFKDFYERVRDKGFILYPGKLTQVETFRVGCIGAIGPDEMRHAVHAIRDTLREMGIRQATPAVAARAAATGAAGGEHANRAGPARVETRRGGPGRERRPTVCKAEVAPGRCSPLPAPVNRAAKCLPLVHGR